MPGKVVSLCEEKAIGWALHPYLSSYPVLVHIVHKTQIIRSVIADHPPPIGNEAVHSGKWFGVGLGEFEFTTSQLAELMFLIGETDEIVAVDRPEPRNNRNGSTLTTVEDLLVRSARRHWVSGATTIEAEQAGLSDSLIIDFLYRDFLGRHADPDGLANYVLQRRQGIRSFHDIRKALVESQEYKQRRWCVGEAPGAIFSQGLILLAATQAREQDDLLSERLELPPFPAGPDTTMQVANATVMPVDQFGYQGDADRKALSVILSNLRNEPHFRSHMSAHTSIVTGIRGERLDQELPLASVSFGSGWYGAETHHESVRPFRWMQCTGIVLNPNPELPCSHIIMNIAAIYRTHEPMLLCFLDDTEMEVEVKPQGAGFIVVISPYDKTPVHYLRLRIESEASGCPLLDNRGLDDRVLSIRVDRMIVTYDTMVHRAGARGCTNTIPPTPSVI